MTPNDLQWPPMTDWLVITDLKRSIDLRWLFSLMLLFIRRWSCFINQSSQTHPRSTTWSCSVPATSDQSSTRKCESFCDIITCWTNISFTSLTVSFEIGFNVLEFLNRAWLGQNCIPHICHEPTSEARVNYFLAGVNFYRFNAKNWHFTVYFAVITQKIGNLLCILS